MVTLAEFVNYIRDAASRFLLRVEQARAAHPGLYPQKQSFSLWLRAFLEFVRAERAQNFSSTADTKVNTRKRGG